MKFSRSNPYGQKPKQQKRIKSIFKQGLKNKQIDRLNKNEDNTNEYLRSLKSSSETPQQKVDKQVKKIHNIINKVERTILK